MNNQYEQPVNQVKKNGLTGIQKFILIGSLIVIAGFIYISSSTPNSQLSAQPTPVSTNSGLQAGDRGVVSMSDPNQKVLIPRTYEYEQQLIQSSKINDTVGIAKMEAVGQVFMVNSGTKVLVLASKEYSKQLRILEGEHLGDTGWLPTEFVKVQ